MYGFHVGKYASPMDPMGIFDMKNMDPTPSTPEGLDCNDLHSAVSRYEKAAFGGLENMNMKKYFGLLFLQSILFPNGNPRFLRFQGL